MVRAWIVRGGRDGEFEDHALTDGLSIVGWDRIGDLQGNESPDELGDLLTKSYPDESAGTIARWKHQLRRFLTMATGDLVVMPRKDRPVVAIGRLTGDYEARSNSVPAFRHVRAVTWLRTNVERAAIKGDLRDSMGAYSTVSELSRRDAAHRVQVLADTGTDPGYDGAIEPPANVTALESDVEAEGIRQLTARDLIGLWGYRRRGSASEQVDQELAHLGLRVEPHFDEVPLDGLVTVSPVDTTQYDEQPAGADGAVHEPSGSGSRTAERGANTDLSWRIGSLLSVREVVTVEVDAPLGRAIARMVEGGFSQLPVVNHNKVLHGVITWESIAQAQLRGHEGKVSDALDAHPRTARRHEELFARIGDIQDHDFLIIVDEENIVFGILTAADLAGQLQQRVEPFTLLEEVERRLRRTTSHLRSEDLPGQAQRKRQRGENFTLGNYKFIVEDETCWEKLSWPYEKEDMVGRLEAVANYRNALAHWDLDGPDVDSESLASTKRLLKLLKVIDRDSIAAMR
ncbi:CBS domain-containing protein [Streptomyces sp. NPDC002851]